MSVEKITVKDIATQLGLSFSTVARALKDNYRVSNATKQKVKECAKELGYQPNLIAQSLKNKKNRSIGVLLCNIPNSFFAEVISGIESVAYDKNYQIIITQSHESYERELQNIEHLKWRSVDGLIISLSTETKDVTALKKLNEQGTPIVFFDRITDEINTHTVTVDNAAAVFKTITHLINNNYKKIAHVTSSPNISITRERLNGYCQALIENNIEIQNDYIKYCNHGGMNFEEVEKAIDELLAMSDPPDAIFTASDRLTLACFSILRKKNIKIPEEISIAGFSNFNYPELFSPSLTTIKQPAFEMGKTATELLIQLIEAKHPVKQFEKRVLATELFIRESSMRALNQ